MVVFDNNENKSSVYLGGGGIPQDTSGSVGEVRGPESGVGVVVHTEL